MNLCYPMQINVIQGKQMFPRQHPCYSMQKSDISNVKNLLSNYNKHVIQHENVLSNAKRLYPTRKRVLYKTAKYKCDI